MEPTTRKMTKMTDKTSNITLQTQGTPSNGPESSRCPTPHSLSPFSPSLSDKNLILRLLTQVGQPLLHTDGHLGHLAIQAQKHGFVPQSPFINVMSFLIISPKGQGGQVPYVTGMGAS